MGKFEELKNIPTRVHLDKRYPLSVFSILDRSFWFLAAIAVALFSYLVFIFGPSDPFVKTEAIDNWAAEVFVYIIFGVALAFVIKFAYECLYYYLYSYKIELEHIAITKGVILRSRDSAPIAKINDICISRNFIQMIFGLYSIDIQTASPVLNNLKIDNVAKESALGIQEFLLAMVETTLPNVREQAAEKIIREEIAGNQADKLLHRAAL